MIAAVPDEKLKEKYFFDGCTLYTFFEDSLPIKVLVDFDKDLNKTYFLCNHLQTIFHSQRRIQGGSFAPPPIERKK